VTTILKTTKIFIFLQRFFFLTIFAYSAHATSELGLSLSSVSTVNK